MSRKIFAKFLTISKKYDKINKTAVIKTALARKNTESMRLVKAYFD